MNKLKVKDKRFELVDSSTLDSDLVVRPNISYWQDAWRRLKKNPVAMGALCILFVIISMAIFMPIIRNLDYQTVVTEKKNLSPSSEFWWGTDAMGRDLFTRVWIGTRISISVALIATVIDIVVGCLYGGIAAYLGGIVDEIMMRIVEVLNSIPYLIITLLILVVLGNGYFQLMLALCLTAWTSTARMIRGQILQLRESEYVLAAEALGASPMRIILKHLLPNTIGLIILDVASTIPSVIVSETILSFLGLGLNIPAFSLGSLLSAGQQAMAFYPYQLLFPTIILCLLILSFNVLGDGLRDALDPKLRQ
ncbi:ABC transporter permease [Clostridium tertium]|jgi:oligopeptide transport system permease protein|uniref:ABC transporter permease n=1 Tax=Clostridium TaxID=1485 RepID=UPI0018AC2094|nr:MULTISPECIES: ABC transporter permease [Clostridium]MBS5307158.1 ABC transporter permease [Clostridium sp.]MDB1923030.1 ABC transporter permease [Clostridium tertium]MDB1926183.1 ABC transporter permease [Clostridium tertium]MDB1930816.1 ABC transporter permease [Clostridium tertium]MDB1934217.1 ABC transporter permease [Clostridium tertium]